VFGVLAEFVYRSRAAWFGAAAGRSGGSGGRRQRQDQQRRGGRAQDWTE
jgi:hypothetical protein